MTIKLPPDAFAYFASLGPARTHKLVADHYGVAARTVQRAADRENWNERIQAIEDEARKAVDAKLAGDLAEMYLRHRKLLTAMAARAATALRDYPLENGMDGIKAASMVIKLERLLAGEPTDRSAVDIEAITKREIRELLVIAPVAGAVRLEGGDDDDA